MSTAYNIYVTSMLLLFTPYYIRLLVSYRGYFSKKTYYVLFYLGASLYSSWIIRCLQWLKLGDQEVTPENLKLEYKLNLLRLPIIFIYYIQFGYITFLLAKAHCIISSISLEELNEKLITVNKKTRMITIAYMLTEIPMMLMQINFISPVLLIKNMKVNQFLLLLYFAIYIANVVFWIYYSIFVVGVITRMSKTFQRSNRLRLIGRTCIMVSLWTYSVSDLLLNMRVPLSNIDLLGDLFGISLSWDLAWFSGINPVTITFFILDSLTFFMLGFIVLAVLDYFGIQQKEQFHQR